MLSSWNFALAASIPVLTSPIFPQWCCILRESHCDLSWLVGMWLGWNQMPRAWVTQKNFIQKGKQSYGEARCRYEPLQEMSNPKSKVQKSRRKYELKDGFSLKAAKGRRLSTSDQFQITPGKLSFFFLVRVPVPMNISQLSYKCNLLACIGQNAPKYLSKWVCLSDENPRNTYNPRVTQCCSLLAWKCNLHWTKSYFQLWISEFALLYKNIFPITYRDLRELNKVWVIFWWWRGAGPYGLMLRKARLGMSLFIEMLTIWVLASHPPRVPGRSEKAIERRMQKCSGHSQGCSVTLSISRTILNA